jgi:hypothetical protein
VSLSIRYFLFRLYGTDCSGSGITGGILGVYYRVYINRQKFTDPTWYAAAISLVM